MLSSQAAILIDKAEVGELPSRRRPVNRVQNGAPFPHMTVAENVADGLKPRRPKLARARSGRCRAVSSRPPERRGAPPWRDVPRSVGSRRVPEQRQSHQPAQDEHDEFQARIAPLSKVRGLGAAFSGGGGFGPGLSLLGREAALRGRPRMTSAARLQVNRRHHRKRGWRRGPAPRSCGNASGSNPGLRNPSSRH